MARDHPADAAVLSGAAIAAALRVAAREEMREMRILIIVPSCAERYLSTDRFAGF